MTYQPVPIPRIHGLNQDEDPTSLRDGELSVALNVYRRGELVGTRPGAIALGTGADYEDPIDEANPVRGAVEFRRDFDQGRLLLTVAEHSSGDMISYEDNARLDTAAVQISADQDYVWSFALHRNVLYGTGGPPGKTGVTTEDVFTHDGNTANPVALLTLTDKGTAATLRPKFIKQKWGYVLVNGLQGGTVASNNPACTRYHDFGSDATNDANWPDSNTIGFSAARVGGIGTEDFCTGFGDYQDNDGDFLMVLGNRGIAAVQRDAQFGNDFVTVDAIETGCVHERAFVSLGLDAGDAVYVSEKGIHSLRQSQQFGGTDAKFLSWKIRPFIESLNRARIHYTVGAYAPRYGGILFAFSTGTETEHNALMWLDVKDGQTLTANAARWYGPWILANDVRVNHLAYMRDASEQYQLFLFTTTGDVLQLSEESAADIGQGYATSLLLNHQTFNDVAAEKRAGDTMVTLATQVGGYNINHRLVFDYGRRFGRSRQVEIPSVGGAIVGSAVVGTAVVGGDFTVFAKKIATKGRGHTVAHEFSHQGVNQPFYVARIDQRIAGAGEDAGDTQ